MGAMKNYFEYACYLECGIPAVTMLGTLDDWLEIRSRIERLNKMGKQYKELSLWYNLLVIVLDEFINSYKFVINLKWVLDQIIYLDGH